ncbi:MULTISPECIES: flotillin family protein [unclassified Variovorax]|uniref:flotillin family protein n=1 Tax=unclassified Variovorax TaxID=663243 RepID=UPI0013182076|nr:MULTISPECIES: flotillin domain-containing protein [unclassified Variovorax]VTU42896.1 Inner membrane protein YqiK [Variovorax sp. PBL-H6]VTU43599.1 Inner membrane protein YqiK [Variovorax sp. SRS16]VTU43661.1 Inner membrane protein YqiK [Variovorax sp. PBL-E5]
MSFLSSLAGIGIPLLAVLIVIVVIGFVLSKLYVKVDAERTFVRTGMGGRKVVLSGGALVLPIFHSITWVNLKTLRLEVTKKDDHSLVTGDRLRVDVGVDFFVRVGNNAESIGLAAQTLGDLTTKPELLARQVEAKFVDALRAVAAKMALNELHQQRHEFSQAVQNAVAPDLAKNGLEMESVSLTSLNQTDKRYFNVDNVLDAEGLAKLTAVTEANKKTINDVEQTNQVAIEQRNLEAARQRAEIKRDTAEVTLQNDLQVATMTANREAEIAATQADGRRRSQQASIDAEREIELARVASAQTVKTAETASETAVRLAQQEQAITVSNKTTQEAQAESEANKARALAVAAEEQVRTAQATEIANRTKAVAVIAAQQRAEEDSIGIVVAAEAEQTAANHRAMALRTEAEGHRDAQVARAAGILAEGEATAEALEKHNAAQNTLSPDVIAQQVKLALIAALPEIIAKSVAPLEKIDSIRIANIGGLGGNSSNDGNGGNGNTAGNGGGLVDQVVRGALTYQSQKPVVDSLLAQVGFGTGATLDNLLASGLAVGQLAVPEVAVSTAPDVAVPSATPAANDGLQAA